MTEMNKIVEKMLMYMRPTQVLFLMHHQYKLRTKSGVCTEHCWVCDPQIKQNKISFLVRTKSEINIVLIRKNRIIRTIRGYFKKS